MTFDVTFTDDPTRVLAEAGGYLVSDPVRNTVMLRLLHDRIAAPEPGRYWIAGDGKQDRCICRSGFDKRRLHAACPTLPRIRKRLRRGADRADA